jgi:hypothetical protein
LRKGHEVTSVEGAEKILQPMNNEPNTKQIKRVKSTILSPLLPFHVISKTSFITSSPHQVTIKKFYITSLPQTRDLPLPLSRCFVTPRSLYVSLREAASQENILKMATAMLAETFNLQHSMLITENLSHTRNCSRENKNKSNTLVVICVIFSRKFIHKIKY